MIKFLNKKPQNKFKQQILVNQKEKIVPKICETHNIFGTNKHLIEYDTRENVITIKKQYLGPKITKELHSTAEDRYD